MSPKPSSPLAPSPAVPRVPVKPGAISATTRSAPAAVPWPRLGTVLFALLAAAVPLGYVLYTGHIWEDYFITFRHSQNLVEGKGLLYNPPERVHGFTSPLGVLLPALCYLVTGKSGYLPALWLFRAVSLLAYVGAGLLVLGRLGRTVGGGLAATAFGLLYLLDVKAVGYSVNGMETGFMLLFWGWCLSLWGSTDPRAWLARGLAWAGLMWTRPDGCVFITAATLAELVFAGAHRRGTYLRSLIRSAAMAAVVYLPWFSWAWWYYGSPVPQTIRAKAPVTVEHSIGPVLARIHACLPHRAASVFGPVYFPQMWPEPSWLYWFVFPVGIFCLIYWLLPVSDRLGRTASLCFAVLCAYLAYIPLQFSWYYPPVTLCGLVVLARGLTTLSAAAAGAWGRAPSAGRLARILARLVLAPVAVGLLAVFALTLRQIKLQQALVEDGNRRQIGLWLRGRVRPQDTVFVEPLGYIGYFSGAHMRDWPGLVDPEVAVIRHQGLWHDAVVSCLQPTWLVLRPREAESIWYYSPIFRERYRPVKLFDVSGQIDAVRHRSGAIPGEPYLRVDATFLVFARKDAVGASPPPEAYEDAERCREYFIERVLKGPRTPTQESFFGSRS